MVRDKYLKHMKDMKYMLAYLQFLGMFCLVVNFVCLLGQSMLSMFQVTQRWWEIKWMSSLLEGLVPLQ